MDLGVGEAFGEEFIVFNRANTYSFRVTSNKMTLLSISKEEFIKKYRRMM